MNSWCINVCGTASNWNDFYEVFSPVEPPTLSFLHSYSSNLKNAFHLLKKKKKVSLFIFLTLAHVLTLKYFYYSQSHSRYTVLRKDHL